MVTLRAILSILVLSVLASSARFDARSIDLTVGGCGSLGCTDPSSSCPNHLPDHTVNGISYCCPGELVATNLNSLSDFQQKGYCCVDGGVVGNSNPVIFSSCFPFCSDTSSQVVVHSLTTRSCLTKIPVSASDYLSQVVAAASRLGVTGDATTTAISSPSSTTTSTTTASGSVASHAPPASSATSTGAAVAMITGMQYVNGGAAVAIIAALGLL